MYIMQLVIRCVILAACILVVIFDPQQMEILEGWNFFRKLSPFHLLWLSWMLDMLWQLVPVKKRIVIALGSQKHFRFSEEDIQYLYARTWFGADSNWLSQAYVQNLLSLLTADVRDKTLMQQAQTGLVLHRLGRTNEAQRIMERIRQQAMTSSEQGMFWGKEYNGRYYRWYQAPIERQAVLIEAFNIISPNKQELDQMKQWLLMQKHQQGWSNTKATAEAIFALMMGDASVLNTESNTILRVGDARFVPAREATSVPGTGYFTKSWTEGDITPKLAEITVAADTSHFVFGACYWQYVEDINKVSESATGLRVQRVLYHEVRGPEGLQLVPVTEDNPARLGEKLTVRLTITSDRDAWAKS